MNYYLSGGASDHLLEFLKQMPLEDIISIANDKEECVCSKCICCLAHKEMITRAKEVI